MIASVDLNGVVDPIIADHIVSVIQRANDDQDAAVLLTIDTPGGLGSSMDEIDEAILNSAVPVIGYVAPSGARAASAGAFVLMSSPVAAMAPGTNVGASTPIGLSGGDLSDKVTNDAAASMRKLAQTYGRNADVAETFVTRRRASRRGGARPERIDLIAASQDDLLAQLDGTDVTLANGSTVTLHTAGATIDEEPWRVLRFPAHAARSEPRVHLLLARPRARDPRADHPRPHLLGHDRHDPADPRVRVVRVLPVRIIGIALLVLSVIAFIVELKAPGFGVWGVAIVSLLLGGWFLYDRAGGVEVSPPS